MLVLACNRSGRAALGDKQEMEFPGTAMLCDPLGRVVTRRDDGELLTADLTDGLLEDVRRRVPCARDLQRAGLHPLRPAELPS